MVSMDDGVSSTADAVYLRNCRPQTRMDSEVSGQSRFPASLNLAGSNRSETSAVARSCFECGGPPPLSSGETWLAGETAEALHFCRFRVYPVTCHSKRKCPQAGKWKRSSRRRAAGCPKRRQVAALESGPFDASRLRNATGRSGLRVSDSFIKATKLTTRLTTKFAPGFVPQAAIRLSLS